MSSLTTETVYGQLLRFLNRLDEYRVPYTLANVRPEAIMVGFALPGERWEVEFMEGGWIEVERFASDGMIEGESALEELWRLLGEDTK